MSPSFFLSSFFFLLPHMPSWQWKWRRTRYTELIKKIRIPIKDLVCLCGFLFWSFLVAMKDQPKWKPTEKKKVAAVIPT